MKSSSKTPHLIDRAEIDSLRQKISELVIQNPQKAAVILSEWLKSKPQPKTQPQTQPQPKETKISKHHKKAG